MERFKRLDKVQKIILLALAVMILIFSVIYPFVLFRKGFLYQDSILVPRQENGATVYSGKIHGEEAIFTVLADRTIQYTWGTAQYGPYLVREDPGAVPEHEMSDMMTGLEIRNGDELMFRGGVVRIDSDGSFWLFNEDGSSASISFDVTYGDGTGAAYDQDGNEVDLMAPSATAIIKLFYGPELTHKGTGFMWFFGVFLCVLTAVSILYAEELFRWTLSFWARNAEHAQPSELELSLRYLRWVILSILALVSFVMGLG